LLLLIIFISLRTITPIALGFYENQGGDLKNLLSRSSEKIISVSNNTFQNISYQLSNFNEDLVQRYRELPEQINLSYLVLKII